MAPWYIAYSVGRFIGLNGVSITPICGNRRIVGLIARIMTGNNADDFLLGVTYLSMTEIEATFDALGTSPFAVQIYTAMDVNQKNFITIQGSAS